MGILEERKDREKEGLREGEQKEDGEDVSGGSHQSGCEKKLI